MTGQRPNEKVPVAETASYGREIRNLDFRWAGNLGIVRRGEEDPRQAQEPHAGVCCQTVLTQSTHRLLGLRSRTHNVLDLCPAGCEIAICQRCFRS